MKYVISTVLNVFALILPIFLRLNIIFDVNIKKAYFNVKIFGINIIGGYLTFDLSKIYIHITDKKCIIFNYLKYIKNMNKKIKINTIEIVKINAVYQTDAHSLSNNLSLLGLFNLINNVFLPLYKYKKSFISLKNDFAVCNKKVNCVYVSVLLFFNFLGLNVYFAKKIINKVRLWKTKKAI